MKITAEANSAEEGRQLLVQGAGEVLVPSIGSIDAAVATARDIERPDRVAVHVPARLIDDPQRVVDLLSEAGIWRILLVSGNPGHGQADRSARSELAWFRERGFHISVGAYPESYFGLTGDDHRAKSARILQAKQAAGADRIITQSVFSARNLTRWLRHIREEGVELPVQVGVMMPVPAAILKKLFRQTRAEIFSANLGKALSRANLDLLFRMLLATRLRLFRPRRVITRAAEAAAFGAPDGFHLFAFGRDISQIADLVAALDRDPHFPSGRAAWLSDETGR